MEIDPKILKIWKGSFVAYQCPKFANLHAQHTGRKLLNFDSSDISGIGILSRHSLFGATTLYAYDPPMVTDDNLKNWVIEAKKRKAARLWLCSPRIEGKNPNSDCLHTLIRTLDTEETTIWKELNSKTRNMVRRGVREGMQIEINADTDTLREWWPIYHALARNHGFSMQPGALIKEALREGIACLGVARKGGRVVAGMVFLLPTYPVYWIGATDHDKGRFASQLLLWESIRFFNSSNYPILDLGGLDPTQRGSVSLFKRGFSQMQVSETLYDVVTNTPKGYLFRGMRVGGRLLASFSRRVRW